MTNVTRYEYDRTKGWKVRAKGHPQKLFSDGRYGGKAEANRAAAEYLQSLPVEARTRARFHRRHRRNKSGHIGVSKIVGRTGKTRGWRVVWCDPPGCVRGKDFLVSRLGTSKVAKRLAVAFRKQVVNGLRPAPEPA